MELKTEIPYYMHQVGVDQAHYHYDFIFPPQQSHVAIASCTISLYHCTRFHGKDETVLKIIFQNICFGIFFSEQNFILWIFLSGMSL